MKKLLVLMLLMGALFGVTSATIVSYPDKVQEHLQYLNEYREMRGLNKLIYHTGLSQCIETYLRDQIVNNYNGHTGKNGSSPDTRCSHVLNTSVGENLIAASYMPSPKIALLRWKNSTLHNQNLLDSRYKYVGIAAVYDESLKRARRGQLFSWDTDFMGWQSTPVTSLYDNIMNSGNVQQNNSKPDMLYRNIIKTSSVRSGGKKYLRLYLTLDFDIDRGKTSLMSQSIVTMLARIFEPL